MSSFESDPAMADTRFLEQRRLGWYAVVEVPKSKQATLGRRLRKSLQTRSLPVAQSRRWAVIAEFRARISEAGAPAVVKSDVARGLELREALRLARQYDADGSIGYDDSEEPFSGLEDIQSGLMADELRALSDSGHAARADLIYGVATGKATPLEIHVEQWLREGGRTGPFKERTKGDHRRAVALLKDWLAAERLSATIEVIDRAVAGRFVSGGLHDTGKAPKTVSKTISSLSSYWDWLRRRGHAPSEMRSPWSEQSPPKGASRDREKERPFTRTEVERLVAECADHTLRDFMLVAALSGLRREEIGRLRIGDCAGGLFVVQRGKTVAARRRVPVHSALRALVEKRMEGKASDAYLFHDLHSQREERTDAIGKAFGRYMRRLGIADHGDGLRRSLVNFHSFRRFFVTEAVNAGQPPHMVSLLVGHTEGRAGMTLGLYWSGANDDALRDVVEGVKWSVA